MQRTPQPGGSPDFELRDIEAFLAVVETGSFTRAAECLYLTQPSVSARIAALERAFGAQLLERSPRGASLTPAGEVLLRHARAILREREEAARSVRVFLGEPAGPLHVAASTVPGTYLLPGVLARLRRLHPKLRIRLDVRDTDEALDVLRHHEAELAVVGRAVEESGFETSVVGEDEVVLVATPETLQGRGRALAASGKPSLGIGGKESAAAAARYELGCEELEDLPLVLREPGSATRAAALTALEKLGISLHRLDIALEVASNAAAIGAALAGAGAAFLSRLAVEDHLRDGRLVELRLDGLAIRRPLVLVRLWGRTLSPGAAALVRLLSPEHR